MLLMRPYSTDHKHGVAKKSECCFLTRIIEMIISNIFKAILCNLLEAVKPLKSDQIN